MRTTAVAGESFPSTLDAHCRQPWRLMLPHIAAGWLFRAFMQRKAYKLVILAVHKLQSTCRSRMARQNFKQTTQAIRIVQRLFRGNHARARVATLRLQTQCAEAETRRVFELQCTAAVALQAAWKGHVGRKAFHTIKAVVRLQALMRGTIVLIVL